MHCPLDVMTSLAKCFASTERMPHCPLDVMTSLAKCFASTDRMPIWCFFVNSNQACFLIQGTKLSKGMFLNRLHWTSLQRKLHHKYVFFCRESVKMIENNQPECQQTGKESFVMSSKVILFHRPSWVTLSATIAWGKSGKRIWNKWSWMDKKGKN